MNVFYVFQLNDFEYGNTYKKGLVISLLGQVLVGALATTGRFFRTVALTEITPGILCLYFKIREVRLMSYFWVQMQSTQDHVIRIICFQLSIYFYETCYIFQK